MNKTLNKHIKEFIKTANGISRKELASILSLNMRTATAHMEGLCRQGVVRKTIKRVSGRGRPETLYYPAPKENLHFAGLFLSDSKIVSVVKDYSGKILETLTEPYHLNWATINHTIKRITRIFNAFAEKGISVNAADLAFFASRTPEFRKSVCKHLQAALGIPISLSTPISAFAWEIRAKNPQKDRIALVHFGMSRIEFCRIEGSREIFDNYEYELAHTQMYLDGPPCYCGKQGCLEYYVLGFALAEEYRELKKLSAYEEINLLDFALAGDADALNILLRAGAATAKALEKIRYSFNPDLLVLFAFENELATHALSRYADGKWMEKEKKKESFKIYKYHADAGLTCASASAEKARYLNSISNSALEEKEYE